jgi:glycosyltransferase involved in cell wall biosynthesis
MRDVEPAERSRVRDGVARAGQDPTPSRRVVVVPWETTYVLLEVLADPPRSARLRAVARFSGVRATALCYDLIPVTSSETSSPGMTGVFAHYLTALKYFERLCTISEATAEEYRGWRVMLPAAGLQGPEVLPVLLPASVEDSSEEALAIARESLGVGTLPLVLVVGSHEPRKNHLAVLQAAEILWREGRRFSLCFIGSRSWRSDEFHERLRVLQNIGRPVETMTSADDALLWAAYRIARFTVFPSVNEGFGLPVAESLAVGTPVITSAFGSTKEIADGGGGALLVDPHDDDDITAAMRRLLVDDEVFERLRAEAAARPHKGWDDYAAEVWDALISSPWSSSGSGRVSGIGNQEVRSAAPSAEGHRD